MTLKKHILSIIVCSFCLFISIGCKELSPNDDPTDDPIEDPTDDPTEDPTDDPTVGTNIGEITLSWNPQSILGSDGRDLPIYEYRIYRSNVSGHLSLLNTIVVENNPPLSSDSTYTDQTVISDQIYYYAISAVSLMGDESPRSTEIGITAP